MTLDASKVTKTEMLSVSIFICFLNSKEHQDWILVTKEWLLTQPPVLGHKSEPSASVDYVKKLDLRNGVQYDVLGVSLTKTIHSYYIRPLLFRI